MRNIKAAYVYDAITSTWSSHGDQRLFEYQQPDGRNYLTPIDSEQFIQAFNHWLSDQTPGINFGKDIKALVTIHANLTYLSTSVPDGDTFELEHIVARKLINDIEGKNSKKKVYGNSLGNCMYLPKSDNNAKKYKDLYSVNKYNQYSQLIEESDYFSQDEMNLIHSSLDTKDYESLNRIITRRAHTVANKIVEGLLQDSLSRQTSSLKAQ